MYVTERKSIIMDVWQGPKYASEHMHHCLLVFFVNEGKIMATVIFSQSSNVIALKNSNRFHQVCLTRNIESKFLL